MKRFLLIGLVSLVVLYAIPLVLVYVFQRNFLYFPPNEYLSPSEVGLSAAQEVRLERSDKARVTGWWIAPTKEGAPVIMFFHGNGSAVFSKHAIYSDIAAQGFGVFGVGYPGYPGSDGRPSQEAIVEAAILQYDWVRRQGVAPERIVFYGTSLGSGAAAQLALERRPAKLILEAPFNAAVEVGQEAMPVFPVHLLMKDKFRSDAALALFDMPLIWVHGTADSVVPFSQGEKLYAAYQGPKTKLTIEGGEHTNLWELGGREFILSELSR